MGSTDPRPKPINWPRELADAADTIERLLKLRWCTEPACRNGLVPDTAANYEPGADWHPADFDEMPLIPCPRCRRDWDALKHARAVVERVT